MQPKAQSLRFSARLGTDLRATAGNVTAWLIMCGLVLLSAGCSFADPSPTRAATPTPAPEDDPEPTATAEAIGDESSDTVVETADLVYRSVDGVDFLMDVFVPPGDGPWPVVVSFHACCGDPEGKDIPPTVAVAEAAAAEGMLVFTPTWLTFGDLPLTSATLDETADRVACAVAAAQAVAGKYGGDPATTVVDGFSAGATAALAFAAEASRTEPIVGCVVDASAPPVQGFVLGDSEGWLHTNFFDGAFAADLEPMRERIAGFLSPADWEQNTDARFFIWTSEEATQPREIGDLSDEAGWFAQRDGDGSIEADLNRLGQLDDGIVDYRDASELLHLRLSEAGLASTLDIYPGPHTTLDKVAELLGYFQAASATG